MRWKAQTRRRRVYKHFHLKNLKKEVKLLPKESEESREPTGKLTWTAENIRPDIAHSTREASTRNKGAYYQDLKHMYGNLIALYKEEKDVDDTIYLARMVKEIYTLYDCPHKISRQTRKVFVISQPGSRNKWETQW